MAFPLSPRLLLLLLLCCCCFAARVRAQGVYGVEGRFPFLDPAVVQENLYLAADLKNAYYKAPIQLFLRKHGYPYFPCVATPRLPFGEGSGCKKLGFSMFAGERNIASKARMAAAANKALAKGAE